MNSDFRDIKMHEKEENEGLSGKRTCNTTKLAQTISCCGLKGSCNNRSEDHNEVKSTQRNNHDNN